MFDLKGCRMVPLSNKNDYDLFWFLHRHREEYQETVSKQDFPDEINQFRLYLEECFEKGRTHQFLVVSNKTGEVCGTTFLYWSRGEYKTSCFFSPEVRNSRVTLAAVTFTLIFSLQQGVEKVFFSVYVTNSLMNRLSIKAGAVCFDSSISRESGEKVNNYYIEREAIHKLKSLARI